MKENIFTFIESESTLQRFARVSKEAYQEIKADPKKFITTLFSKDKVKGRQYLRLGLVGAAFCWLLGIVVYTGIYFWQSPKNLEEGQHLQLITRLVALPPSPKPKLPPVKAVNRASGGGGGGRVHEMSPPPKGRLPIAELKKSIVAPTTRRPEIKIPILPVTPTINVQPELMVKQDNTIAIGLPTNLPAPPSDGNGDGGGYGGGKNGGVGKGNGDGYGEGIGGNRGSGVNSLGGGETYTQKSPGIKLPIITHTEKARYTEEGRLNKIQGKVVISALLNRNGTITDIKVLRSIGYGLDEEAIKTTMKVKFIPGTKNGQTIDVRMLLEFDFRLL
ncbi:MAG: energy transducer TonB [Acidobacteria bacterium]|nr:energy transducer TonB [Acidobacteriota bacterium]